jgi:FMN phosphatase YigB (HAD superfamily)
VVKKTMPIKAVLFDMFDTLMMIEKDHEFYSHSLKRAHDFLVAKGIKVDLEAFEKAYIESRDALYAVADSKLEEPHFNVRIANALCKLGYSYDASSELVAGATDAFCEGFMTYVRIDEHVKVILKKLHGTFKLGVVSNFAIPECVLQLLEREGLTKFFDVVVVSGAVNIRKPNPQIFRKALDALGVMAEETVFVGDTVDADVEGAQEVGMKTIFIERRVQKGAAEAYPTQTIKSLSEFLLALENCLPSDSR